MINSNAARNDESKRGKQGEDVSSDISVGITEERLNRVSMSGEEVRSGKRRFPGSEKVESLGEEMVVEFEDVGGFEDEDLGELGGGGLVGSRHFRGVFSVFLFWMV